MTESTAMQLSAVYAAVNLISRAVSTAPLCLFQRTGTDQTREATEHPLYKLLRWPPNPEMTKKTAWETFMAHLLLWGNGYQEIERDNADRKSTRLNSSHLVISYAVFCLKKKKELHTPTRPGLTHHCDCSHYWKNLLLPQRQQISPRLGTLP